MRQYIQWVFFFCYLLFAVMVDSIIVPTTYAESFTIANLWANVAPVITSLDTVTVEDGETVVMTVVATDATDNPVMYYGSTAVVWNNRSTIAHSEICSPVVVASARANVDGEVQKVVRVNNKTNTNFAVKVDNQSNSIPSGESTVVDYVVIAAGAHDLSHDNGGTTHIQAGSISTSAVFGNKCKINATSDSVSFNPSFSSAPSVLHSISSNNDPSSVASMVNRNNGNRRSEPSATQMGLFLQRGFGSCAHDPEIIDYIAMDQGHFLFGGEEIDSVVSSDTIDAINATGKPVNFSSAFGSAPQTTLVAQLWEDGGNGWFAVVHNQWVTTATTVSASIDEDGVGADRYHTTEPVGSLAFESGEGTVTKPNTLSYSISNGADASLFTINGSGQLLFVSGQDSDMPGDANADATYEVQVQVCDSHCNQKCVTQDIFVTVNNAPTIDDATYAIDENTLNTTIIGTPTSADPNTTDTLTYTITAGNDDGIFAIDVDGNVTVVDNAHLDYETTTSYVLTVQVSDGDLTDTATITINVNDVNEAPEAIDVSGTISEDATNGTSVATVGATDVDAGDTLTYTITAGNDDGIFAIDVDGNVTVVDNAHLDYETTTSYVLTVQVSDGDLTDTVKIAITVTDVDDIVSTPVIVSLPWTGACIGSIR